MDGFLAKYTEKAADRGGGLGNEECPLCGQVVFELDIESYREVSTKRVVESCASCCEVFEADSGIQLDSDVLDASRFVQLWSRANELVLDGDDDEGGHEGNVGDLAHTLGGEPWQSGGNILLILVHRSDGAVIAISEDALCEYENEAAFEIGNQSRCIQLR